MGLCWQCSGLNFVPAGGGGGARFDFWDQGTKIPHVSGCSQKKQEKAFQAEVTGNSPPLPHPFMPSSPLVLWVQFLHPPPPLLPQPAILAPIQDTPFPLTGGTSRQSCKPPPSRVVWPACGPFSHSLSFSEVPLGCQNCLRFSWLPHPLQLTHDRPAGVWKTFQSLSTRAPVQARLTQLFVLPLLFLLFLQLFLGILEFDY